MEKFSIIIPAFNEEKTIYQIVKTASCGKRVEEVIVINDGSTDCTGYFASLAGGKVINLFKRNGKGAAMDMGVSAARCEKICFLDADIEGLTEVSLDQIMEPVLSEFDMFIALRDKKYKLINKALFFLPLIGGERALTKNLWNKIPGKYKKNFKAEIALNYYCLFYKKKIGCRFFPGLKQNIKEKKWGFFTGFWHRILMTGDIVSVFFSLYIILKVKKLFKTDGEL